MSAITSSIPASRTTPGLPPLESLETIWPTWSPPLTNSQAHHLPHFTWPHDFGRSGISFKLPVLTHPSRSDLTTLNDRPSAPAVTPATRSEAVNFVSAHTPRPSSQPCTITSPLGLRRHASRASPPLTITLLSPASFDRFDKISWIGTSSRRKAFRRQPAIRINPLRQTLDTCAPASRRY